MLAKVIRAGALGGLSWVALAASGMARAQETSAQESAGDQADREIIVTGSRLARRDYNSASPIVTVNESFLNSQAGGTFAVKLQ